MCPVLRWSIRDNIVHVSSATPVGHVIARLTARDDDVGDNGRLTFGSRPATTKSSESGSDNELVGDYDTVDNAFSVSSEQGTVSVLRSLADIDFRVYYIPLYVVDSGQPIRSGTGTLRIIVNRTIPFNGGAGNSAMSSPGYLLALLSRRDGLPVYVAVAVAVGCCLLVTAPLAMSVAMRRRRQQRRPSDKNLQGDGEIVQPTDRLMSSPALPPPPSTDVATVRAAVSPYKRNGVVPTAQSLRCLTDDVDVRIRFFACHLSLYMSDSQILCKGKGKKVKANSCYNNSYRCLEVLYNLGSGSWSARANDTAAHYAAIHCPRQRTTGPATCSKQTYHCPNQPH